ncbi:MAG: VWA domain-containing protein [Candidatus Cloacimonas sp.]|nr:VWA domain-containing protein [Candidatus Cloacimonas sp.]
MVKFIKHILSSALALVIMVCGIAVPFSQSQVTAADNQVERYTVLVLDTTGEYSINTGWFSSVTVGSPLSKVKGAANKFIEAVLNADGKNYVSIVTFGTESQVVSEFSSNVEELTNKVSALPETDAGAASGLSNSNSGFESAGQLMEQISKPNAIKNIVFFTGCVPGAGASSTTGHYEDSSYDYTVTKTGVYVKHHANSLYDTCESLKNNGNYIYTLGCYTNLNQNKDTYDFLKLILNDIQNAGFYNAENPDDLDFIFGEVADKIIDNATGTFYYPGAEGRDYPAIYYYRDSYFNDSAYVYNNHLATMSLCLELSAWASNEVPNTTEGYKQKSKNAEKLLTDIGFSEFKTNNGYQVKPTKDSIGVVAANKQIKSNGKDYTLVALAVRGGGYESEWASNFTLGTGSGYSDADKGRHKGFYEARDQVRDFASQYLRDNVEGDVKLWIVGYSRGGATAGLTAAWFDENYTSFGADGISMRPEDIYAYTFAAPQGTVYDEAKDQNWSSKPLYKNIHNTINPADPVPKVAMSAWSFVRFGNDIPLPTSETDSDYATKKAKMLTQLQSLANQVNYGVDTFQMKKIQVNGRKFLPGGEPFIEIADDSSNHTKQAAFLDNYITRLVTEDRLIKNRNRYVNNYESNLREILGIFFGADSHKSEKMIESAVDKFKNNWGDIVKPLYWNNPFKSAETKEKECYEVVARFLRESLDEAGIPYNRTQFDTAVVAVADLLIAVAVNHPNLALSLGLNMEGIGTIHNPETYLAWLMSFDGYYTGEESTEYFFAYPAYRIVHINCPVDVEVFDENGTKVAEIINDVPQEIAGSSIVSALAEGEKLVYLPADKDYSVKIVATADGVMNYAVNEFSYDSGKISRAVNHYDVPLSAGKAFTAQLPAVEGEGIGDGSNANYTLSDENGVIPSNDDIKGEAVDNAYFSVNVSSEDESKGLAYGSGAYLKGNSALVTAVAYEGYVFEGWYKGSAKLSSDAEYKFNVTSDETLVAKFIVDTNTPTETTTHPTTTTPSTTTTTKRVDSSPKTGDDSNIEFLTLIFGISVLVAFALRPKAKKHS